MHAKGDDEEIILDAENGEEVELEQTDASATALAKKLKIMRKDLAEVKKERDANLAGWQRAKADLINLRRMTESDIQRANARGIASVAQEVLPAMDSFEAAVQAPEWQTVPETWRNGVIRIKEQLQNALTRAGLESFGSANEPFNPTLHECMSVVPAKKQEHDDIIAQVLQKGYRLKEEVIRPAKVAVYQYSESPPE